MLFLLKPIEAIEDQLRNTGSSKGLGLCYSQTPGKFVQENVTVVQRGGFHTGSISAKRVNVLRGPPLGPPL